MKMVNDQSELPVVSIEDLFIHLVYEYRLLANAAYGWDHLGPDGNDKEQKTSANELVPEISSILQDSLLLHVRNLLQFYQNKVGITDIRVSDFENIIIEEKYCCFLKEVKARIDNEPILKHLSEQISVHVLHPTKWRDETFRNTKRIKDKHEKDREKRLRPTFDCINRCLFSEMIKLLEIFRDSVKTPHVKKLQELIDLSKLRYEGGSKIPWEYKFS